jgi:two-component system chemotaxis response regulator CheB
MPRKLIKVLIVDDSALIRQLLKEILGADESFEIVGEARDAYEARDLIKQLNPDVITLDIEMPGMNGIAFLKNIMRLRPMPVVMISTLTEKGAAITLEALELGAVDFVTKPKIDPTDGMHQIAQVIQAKVRSAARANINAIEHNSQQQQFNWPIKPSSGKRLNPAIKLIAIGASTGGTEAIKETLLPLPMDMPPIVIVQHMPPGFTKSFADRLDNILPHSVHELTDRRALEKGHIYIANGAEHLIVAKHSSGQLFGYCEGSETVNRHRPSVDKLFHSVAEQCANTAIAVILTGMGMDGANGLKAIQETGAKTIAQDEKSSVVWGMPRAAVELNAADDILPLNKIGQRLIELCYH